MNNPTKLTQNEVIDCCIRIINSWKNSNDISSPTVSSDIDEETKKLEYDNVLSEIQTDKLSIKLRELLKFIKTL